MTDQRIIEHYDKLLAPANTSDHEKVGWGSKKSQYRRFQALSEIATPLSGNVLDVGCGTGALYEYLAKNNAACSYHGVDINQNMVEEARDNYPAGNFDVADILSWQEPQPTYDWVFMSGAANLAQDGHGKFLLALINQMFACARVGVAFNLLSNRADFFSPGEVYCDPANILNHCLGLTSRATLRHDYMPHDFTVYLFRDH